MRKRMSRMKKEMAVAVAAAMCISLVGCGGGSSKKVVADKSNGVQGVQTRLKRKDRFESK